MIKDFPILVVDDNQVTRNLLKIMLSKAGYQVMTANNGRKALDFFKENFFPIVLTDWMMPELSGIEFCRIIREENTKGYVYMIMLTANDSKDCLVTGLKAGADDYLTKPFNHAELLARINTGIRILELEKSLKKATEEIRILSITDPLTGCYNRGYLNDHLPQDLRVAKRYKRKFSLILCDIDHFKKVNDNYGHQAGDMVLQNFVKSIKSSIRNVDWVARYGGEEFLIVLPETDFNGAFCLSERLREFISQKQISLNGTQINITSSFGVTSYDPETSIDISMESLITQVDKYLYLAKTEGRNLVKGSPIISS